MASGTRLLGEQVTAVVVNYQTPDLLEVAVRSFRDAYPEVPVVVIDNGSQDRSRALVQTLERESRGWLEAWLLDENIYHGPAMHLAMERLETPYVFFLDSDTHTQRAGFLEAMVDAVSPAESYGSGEVMLVNGRGFPDTVGAPALVSAYMLLKRATYHTLPPFVHHGLPALANFEAASARGLALHHIPVAEYVDHLGRGTVERFGYGLGWRSRLDYVLNRLGL